MGQQITNIFIVIYIYFFINNFTHKINKLGLWIDLENVLVLITQKLGYEYLEIKVFFAE